MNLVTFAEVTEVTGTPYHNFPEYYETDILQLKNSQIGITSIEQILVQYNGDTRNVIAVIGKDSSGNIMKEASHGVVLPCPPIAEKMVRT